MKTKTILISLVAILAVTVLIFQSCKKDETADSANPTSPVYTNGQGEIGSTGGTVKIDDASSPINGASIVIPSGALSSNTTISIVLASDDVNFPGDSTLQLIAFEPTGLEFEKPVQITLPFNGEDMQKARVYYYDDDKDIVSEMPLINTNQANKQVIFETNHFSYYTACEYLMAMKMKMVYNNQALKIGAMSYIDGWNTYALGGGTFYPGLKMIPVEYEYWMNYGSTVEYVVKNADIPLYSHFTVKLYDDDFFFPFKRKIELYIKREKVGNSFTAYVYKYNETGVIYNTDIIEYGSDEGLETWFTGKPLIFYFDDFEFNPEDEYWIKTEWHMAKESDGSPSFTAKYELNNEEDRKKPRDMELISNEDIYNNYIDSEYVAGGGNNPPSVNLQTPSSTQSGNITINYTVTDEDGNNNDFVVAYQSPGTGSNPATLVSTSTGTIDGSTILNVSPGNHSFVWNSNQDYTNNHTSSMKIKMVWDATLSFETNTFEVDNTGTGNTPPTALFTISPSNGTTSTNFVFDASSSTDNEDPTSNLQIRWDFDGDGVWDTNWETEKIDNYQYSYAGTYTAKLEVRDTEDLSDQYTNNINVGNVTSTFTDPRDEQTYTIVDIGNQTWFAENLNYETDNSWWYENSSANGDVYGRLYTGNAAETACPNGWHLPSDEEWTILIDFLGGGDVAGGKMKEVGTAHWNSPNTGATNTSGFNALPAGYRYDNDASFNGLGRINYWWSSTGAWYRSVTYASDNAQRGNYFPMRIRSVRCIKD